MRLKEDKTMCRKMKRTIMEDKTMCRKRRKLVEE